ncbi:MAG: hypothetical protein QNJ30_08845 [Kiloniellales bacterium]|nr:hypothetical protein [Kiloniellales bacterium]
MQTAIASTGVRIFAACALAFLAMASLAGNTGSAAIPHAKGQSPIELPAQH